MAVTLTSPVLGQAVGFVYTGSLEAWLLQEGYARNAGTLAAAITVTPTAAVLDGTSNAAATLGATGNVIFATKGGVRTTVALLAADLAAGAATKIDTALTGLADAAIVASKLRVTSIATGTDAYVTVVGGDAAVLTGLGVTLGAKAFGGDGRPTGASNLGVQAPLPDDDLTKATNRESPWWPTNPPRNVTIANDATNLSVANFPLARFDFDAASVDTEAPILALPLKPNTGPAVGGTKVRIYGDNLEGTTGVTFGGTAGTALDVTTVDQGFITITTPAKVAGPYTVVVTDNIGNDTELAAFTYTA